MAEHLTIRPRHLTHRILFRVWRGNSTDVEALEKALDTPLPRQPMRFAQIGEARIHALGPGDFVSENWLPLPEIDRRLSDFYGVWSTSDTTAGRASLTVSGSSASDLIACGCSLDLHSRSFAVGACAETLLARVHVLIARSAPDCFDLTFDRSIASYINEWMADARLAF